MAPFGPAPEMVEKLRSRNSSPSRRNASSCASASDLATARPAGASRASQARKRVTATPSRRCAARVPVELDLVLARLRQRAGVRRRARSGRRPWRSRSNTQTAAAVASTATRAPACAERVQRRRRARRAARTATPLPRCARRPGASLRASTNQSTPPSARTTAKDSGSGVCGTSPPRMLSSQAIEFGAVSTAASMPSFGQRCADGAALLGGSCAGDSAIRAARRAPAAAAAGPARRRRAGCSRRPTSAPPARSQAVA